MLGCRVEIQGMKLGLTFGALAPSIKKQLAVSKLKAKTLDMHLWQTDADEIARLLIRGLLTDSAGTNARRKLMRKILANVRAA